MNKSKHIWETRRDIQTTEDSQTSDQDVQEDPKEGTITHSNEENHSVKIPLTENVTNSYIKQLIIIQDKSKSYYTIKSKPFNTKK